MSKASQLELSASAPLRFWELDSLRGIAAVLVVLAHVSHGPLFWSWSLMDMFFVLSSFLLTGVVYRHCTDWRGVLSFYGRRIERIWPLYMLTVLVLMGVAITLSYHHGGTGQDTTVFWRLFTFSQYSEMLFHPVVGYQYPYYARHLWSLAVEEQFYVLLPFAILLARRLPPVVSLAAALGLVAFAIVERAGYPNLYVLSSHVDAFVLGGLMAVGLPLLSAHTRRASWLLGLLTLIGLLLFMPYLIKGYVAHFAGLAAFDYQPLPATASTLFWAGSIGLIALHRGGKWLAPLRWRVFVHLGRLSYALYLVHFPILRLLPQALMAHFPGLNELGAELLCLPLIFVLSELLYRTIDRPVQQKKQTYRLATTPPQHADPRPCAGRPARHRRAAGDRAAHPALRQPQTGLPGDQ